MSSVRIRSKWINISLESASQNCEEKHDNNVEIYGLPEHPFKYICHHERRLCKNRYQDHVRPDILFEQIIVLPPRGASKKAVWIRNFLMDLGVVPGSSNLLDIYCDNNGAIAQAKEPRQHQKNKHILRRYHLIRQFFEAGDIKLCKVHTETNFADPLTKPLSQPRHEAHTRAMGMRCFRHVDA
jgi:hypothetical protein